MDDARARRLAKKRAYYLANKDKYRVWGRETYARHRDVLIAKCVAYQSRNPEQKRARALKFYAANLERIREKDRGEIRRAQKRAYDRKRREEDPTYTIVRRLRGRLWKVLRRQGAKKSDTTQRLVGCSFEDLKLHLEKQFKPGMSWDNQGKWHIDHIRPCASFDFTKESDQKECFHYSNLQPLWAADNLLKSATWSA